jgi:hypothetical protein
LERKKRSGRSPRGERAARPARLQPADSARRSVPGRQPSALTSRRLSAIGGGILIGAAALWFLWLLARQVNPGMSSLRLPFPNPQPARSASAPADPLAVAGITLSAPAQGREPGLTQQQALLVAGQLEAQIATKASGFDARYALFSYQTGITPASSGFHNVPVWVIHYRGVTEPPPDAAADPHATGASHDFYVFLDASSGRELLALWL